MGEIKAIALDVDGVLADGTFWWGPDGQEWKRFSFRDVMGIARARRAGFIVALISGEDSSLIDRYAAKMEIRDVFKGCKDKATALRKFADQHGLALSAIAFMGDDVNDLEAMRLAGFAAVPADAEDTVKKAAAFVSRFPGGKGAVRDLVEYLLIAAKNPVPAGQ